MGIRATYAVARPTYKAGLKNPYRNRSYRSMGRPTTLAEGWAREDLDNNDDHPNRRRKGFLSFTKRQATVAKRHESKQLLREAEVGLVTGVIGQVLVDVGEALL